MSLSCCICGSVSAWESWCVAVRGEQCKGISSKGRGTERGGEQTHLGVWRFDPYLKKAVIEVDVDGFALALSSTWTPSTTVADNPHARSHTLLFCTLFCPS